MVNSEWIKKAYSSHLKGKRIIVTGCGYKPLSHTFHDVTDGKPCHNSFLIDNQEMKLNIGSAIAAILAKNGAIVHMVSRSEEKLKILKNELSKFVDSDLIEYSALDLLDEKSVENFVENLSKDKTLYWVQSVGLGAGSYKLKNDNPYLPLEEIPLELIEKESQIVLKSTHLMMTKLLPILKKQNETKIVIVSSMSAIRGYPLGATHCAAKGAISRYTNAAMLGLFKKNIFITDLRPGAIDTGMYDNKYAIDALLDHDINYGNNWSIDKIGLAPPVSVGEAVNYIFTTSAHIPSLNLVAKGQIPNEGS